MEVSRTVDSPCYDRMIPLYWDKDPIATFEPGSKL